MKYILELTEEQYMHIAESVEICNRLRCGQIDELIEVLPFRPDDKLLYEIKKQSFPELSKGENYSWNGGYRNTDLGEPFREHWDRLQAQGYQIYRQMYHMRNIAKGIDNVYTTPTLCTNKAQQPKISFTE